MNDIKRQESQYSQTSTNSLKELLTWKRPPPYFLLISAVVLVIAGTTDTLIAKLMSRQSLAPCKNCRLEYVVAPVWQTLISYIFEAGMIFVYLWDQHKAKKKNAKFHSEYIHLHTTAKSFVKKSCPFWWWAVPAFLDFATSLGVNFAFIFIHASTCQLLRNFNIIATAILSLLWVQVALRRHQLIGVFLVLIGLIVVAIQEFTTPETTSNFNTPWLGVFFAIAGTLANAIQVVIEERLFRDYHVSPCEALGFFGIFGLIFCVISFIIMEIIPHDGEKFSRLMYMHGIRNHEGDILVLTTCILLFSVPTFNLSGMMVTKLGSCLLRMIVISVRTITIWVIEMLVGWNGFGGWSCSGMIITFIGVMAYNYNYLFKIDYWKHDAWLRKPLFFCNFLKDPDVIEAEAVVIPPKLKVNTSKTSDVQLGTFKKTDQV